MKFLLLALALIMMIPMSANARDEYYRAGVSWNQQVTMKPNISVKSAPQLSKYDLRMIRQTYNLTKKLFFEYWYVNLEQCNLGKLKIKIVRSHFDLSNRTYFPGEAQYADFPNGTSVIFGRYFRLANTMYVVQPDEINYYWRRDFSHEVLHYFFDECGMKFDNDGVEHRKVDEFLKKHRAKFK